MFIKSEAVLIVQTSIESVGLDLLRLSVALISLITHAFRSTSGLRNVLDQSWMQSKLDV